MSHNQDGGVHVNMLIKNQTKKIKQGFIIFYRIIEMSENEISVQSELALKLD